MPLETFVCSVCERMNCVADEPIYLALLLPMSDGIWDAGPQFAGAVPLAVQAINANQALLPGHVLEYRWANSGCSAQRGLMAMGELLGGGTRIHAVIGPACSAACEVTSHLLGGYDLPQISYGWYQVLLFCW